MEKFKELLMKLSYYNAAEGDWHSEAKPRNECREELKKHVQHLVDAGFSHYDILKEYDSIESLTNPSDIFPLDYSILTYRLVDIDPKTYKPRTLFHGIDGSREIELGVEQQAKILWKQDGSGGRYYFTGFHSIETLPLMYKYLKAFKSRRERLRIGIVGVRGLFHKPNSKEGVILSKYQKLIGLVDIGWEAVL